MLGDEAGCGHPVAGEVVAADELGPHPLQRAAAGHRRRGGRPHGRAGVLAGRGRRGEDRDREQDADRDDRADRGAVHDELLWDGVR